MPNDADSDEDMTSFQEALNAGLGGDLSAVKGMADAPGEEMTDLVVDESGAPAPEAGAPTGPAADPNEIRQEIEGEQPQPPARPAAPATPPAQAAAEPPKPQEPSPEERQRQYLGHLPAQRQEEIRIAAANPDMPIAEVEALAKKRLEGTEDLTFEELPIEDRIAVLQKDLDEATQKVADLRWKDDDQFRDASAKKDELVQQMAELRIEAKQAEQHVKSFDAAYSASEAAASKILPELDDIGSATYQAIVGRSGQIADLLEAGKPLPTWTDESGKVHTLDPRNSNFPELVAREHAAKSGKPNAPVAKPGAPAAGQPVTKTFASVPGSASAQTVRQSTSHEGEAPTATLADQAKKVQSEADLKTLLAANGGAWRKRSEIDAV